MSNSLARGLRAPSVPLTTGRPESQFNGSGSRTRLPDRPLAPQPLGPLNHDVHFSTQSESRVETTGQHGHRQRQQLAARLRYLITMVIANFYEFLLVREQARNTPDFLPSGDSAITHVASPHVRLGLAYRVRQCFYPRWQNIYTCAELTPEKFFTAFRLDSAHPSLAFADSAYSRRANSKEPREGCLVPAITRPRHASNRDSEFVENGRSPLEPGHSAPPLWGEFQFAQRDRRTARRTRRSEVIQRPKVCTNSGLFRLNQLKQLEPEIRLKSAPLGISCTHFDFPQRNLLKKFDRKTSPKSVQLGGSCTYFVKTRPNALKTLERVVGIEPASSAWKAAALPLCYTRARTEPFSRFDRRRREPVQHGLHRTGRFRLPDQSE